MRIPVPKNRLVALTLAGALLTTLVAAGLAVPGLGLGLGQPSETPGDSTGGDGGQLGADTPTPNGNFTPAVQTQTRYEGEEDHHEDEHEDGEDDEHGEEYEEAE